ncbi:hypothetical protein C2G38_2055290, partial [Gigaspora rosea]
WIIRTYLNWKEIDYEYCPVNSLESFQKKEEYSETNYKVVSTLKTDGILLSQSHSVKYCACDEVTFGKCCILPQVYDTNRFGIDMTKFPLIQRITNDLSELNAFKEAHPQIKSIALLKRKI